MTPRLKPAHKSPMLAPAVFENLERAKSHYDNEIAFMANNSILDAEYGDFPDEFEASQPAKSELKYDMLQIRDHMPREEDQEIRDRLKSIENFNNDEPHLSPAHHETPHVQYNMLTQSQMFGPIDLGDTFELRNRSLTFHGHNEIFNSLGASAMEMQHMDKV